LRFEAADLLAQRRLSDVQAFGGAAEVQLLGDRDEVLDDAKVKAFDRPSLLIGGSIGLGLFVAADRSCRPE